MIAKIFQKVSKQTIKYDTYFDVYDEVLNKYHGKDIVFVEIGVLGGGSLSAFRDYFGPNSRIIGIDLNPKMKEVLEKDGFEIYIGDQSDPNFWQDFFRTVGSVDVVLDDGGHTYKQQIVTTLSVLPNLNDGGLLMVEDTHTSYMRRFGYPSKFTYLEFSKNIIDKINSRFFTVESKIKESVMLNSVFSIQFFDSIVVLHKNSKLCRRPQKVVNGLLNDGIQDVRSESDQSASLFLFGSFKWLKLFVPRTIRTRIRAGLEGKRYFLENFGLRRYFK